MEPAKRLVLFFWMVNLHLKTGWRLNPGYINHKRNIECRKKRRVALIGDWLQNHQMVPEKLSADIPILFALGQKELKIQNYKKILQYSPKEMILLLKSKRLVIQGDHLDIYYFNADEVCIRGHIVSIIYQSG